MVLSCPSVSHLPKTFVEDKYSFISGNLGERGGDVKFHSNFHTHNLLMIFVKCAPIATMDVVPVNLGNQI